MVAVETGRFALSGARRNESVNQSRWKRAEGTMWRYVLDDVVVLPDGIDCEPFAVSGGGQLWRLLEEPQEISDLAEAVGGHHVHHELSALLGALQEAGVVERMDT